MKRRIDVREEIPDMPDHHAHDLVFGDVAVEDEAEAHEDPGEVGRGEDHEAQEA